MIYVIQADNGGPVKIGYTSGDDAERRCRDLQVGNPERLRIVATFPGTVRDERAIHERFSDARLVGEWFALTPEIRVWAEGRLRARRREVRPPELPARRKVERRPLGVEHRGAYVRILDVLRHRGEPMTAPEIREMGADYPALGSHLSHLRGGGWVEKQLVSEPLRSGSVVTYWKLPDGPDHDPLAGLTLDLSPAAARILARMADDLPPEDAATLRDAAVFAEQILAAPEANDRAYDEYQRREVLA